MLKFNFVKVFGVFFVVFCLFFGFSFSVFGMEFLFPHDFEFVLGDDPVVIDFSVVAYDDSVLLNVDTVLEYSLNPKNFSIDKNSVQDFVLVVFPPVVSGIFDLSIVASKKVGNQVISSHKVVCRMVKQSDDVKDLDGLIDIKTEVRFPNKLVVSLKNFGTLNYEKIIELSESDKKVFVVLAPNETKVFEFVLDEGEHLISLGLGDRIFVAGHRLGVPDIRLVDVVFINGQIVIFLDLDWNVDVEGNFIFANDGQIITKSVVLNPGLNEVFLLDGVLPEKLAVQTLYKTFMFNLKDFVFDEDVLAEDFPAIQSFVILSSEKKSSMKDNSIKASSIKDNSIKVFVLVLFLVVAVFFVLVLKVNDKRKNSGQYLLRKYDRLVKKIRKDEKRLFREFNNKK